MRILITNNTLDIRAGSELYVRDLAIALLKRGHMPIAYSTKLGEIAQEIRAATVPVIDNLEALAAPPDVIHGHHHLDTMTALLRFPGVPAVYFCHGWLPWEETPPRFPRILRYVAVDYLCRDRLLFEHGIPEDRIRVLLNFVDLERFKPRGPLPARPQRALIFSNYAAEDTQIPAVRDACARRGLTTEVVGLGAGNACARPEEILGGYDLVFAKGKAALESLAVGVAVILCDEKGLGPMVTSGELDRVQPLNFGLRTLREPLHADAVERQIARYDAEDAAKVSRLVRANAGTNAVVDQIVSLYEEIIAENTRSGESNLDEEARCSAAYLRWLAPTLKGHSQHTQQLVAWAVERQREVDSLTIELTEQREKVLALIDHVGERQGAVESLAIELTERHDRVLELVEHVGERQSAVDSLAAELEASHKKVITLTAQVAERDAELHEIRSTLGWRLLREYGKIKYRLLNLNRKSEDEPA